MKRLQFELVGLKGQRKQDGLARVVVGGASHTIGRMTRRPAGLPKRFAFVCTCGWKGEAASNARMTNKAAERHVRDLECQWARQCRTPTVTVQDPTGEFGVFVDCDGCGQAAGSTLTVTRQCKGGGTNSRNTHLCVPCLRLASQAILRRLDGHELANEAKAVRS